MTAETPSAAVPARPAVSLDGMAPSPGQRRSSGPERTGTSAGLSRDTRCVLPVLLLLERMYLEEPVHGFGSSGQHRPQLAPVDNLGRPGA